jgi:hypothetical protein
VIAYPFIFSLIGGGGYWDSTCEHKKKGGPVYGPPSLAIHHLELAHP